MLNVRFFGRIIQGNERMMTMSCLEIKNLHVDVDGKAILKGLNLTINSKETHALMGPNGNVSGNYGKSKVPYQ